MATDDEEQQRKTAIARAKTMAITASMHEIMCENKDEIVRRSVEKLKQSGITLKAEEVSATLET